MSPSRRRHWEHIKRQKRARADLRRVMFDEQRGLCWLCADVSRPMTCDDPAAPSYATFDEVTARACGGIATRVNQALAHQDCNQRRGCRAPTHEHLERLAGWRRELRACA